jgi:hypothetical protein
MSEIKDKQIETSQTEKAQRKLTEKNPRISDNYGTTPKVVIGCKG